MREKHFYCFLTASLAGYLGNLDCIYFSIGESIVIYLHSTTISLDEPILDQRSSYTHE